MGELDLTREVAEKVLKRAMFPVRGLLEDAQNYEDGDVCRDEIAYGTLRELDKDLGTLGVALANRYREQMEYQTTLGVLAAENARLHEVIEELAVVVHTYKNQGERLAAALEKARTTEPVAQGFRAS